MEGATRPNAERQAAIRYFTDTSKYYKLITGLPHGVRLMSVASLRSPVFLDAVPLLTGSASAFIRGFPRAPDGVGPAGLAWLYGWQECVTEPMTGGAFSGFVPLRDLFLPLSMGLVNRRKNAKQVKNV